MGAKGTKRHRYTIDQLAFLQARKDMDRKKLTLLFNRRYGTTMSFDAIKQLMLRKRWLSDRDGRFKRGHATWNKGAKGLPSFSPETTFKKGNRPVNAKPVGTERISKDGYIEVKVAEPKKWMTKHRHIWEQYHGKTVPRGHIVIFMDGDNRNFAIENLKAIPRSINGVMSKKGYHELEPEFKEVMINVAAVDVAVSKLENR